MPLLGNRLDRYHWDGSDADVREDDAPRPRAPGGRDQPHQPGACRCSAATTTAASLRAGPDGKIYLQVGDTGRRGQTQNLIDGPFGFDADGMLADDQFGGPDTDQRPPHGRDPAPEPGRHRRRATTRSGRSAPSAAARSAATSRRSSPTACATGSAWRSTRSAATCGSRRTATTPSARSTSPSPASTPAGCRSWARSTRVAQFKAIETTRVPNPPDPQAPGGYYGLQQIRWDPINIADTPLEAYNRLFKLPGSRVLRPGDDLEVRGRPGRHRLPLHQGARQGVQGRPVRRLGPRRAARRQHLPPADRRQPQGGRRRPTTACKDSVADNLGKYEITESESLLFGENFGVTPDIKEGPDGTLYVVSNTQGTVYEIRRK